jgi:uncharacterized caspase-like protein
MTTFQQGHALIIGVGADLPNTVADANGLSTILRDEARCAYSPSQIHLLTGPSATRDAVLNALNTLAQSTDQNATVVVYFSGHGYQVSTSVSDAKFTTELTALPIPRREAHVSCQIHRIEHNTRDWCKL